MVSRTREVVTVPFFINGSVPVCYSVFGVAAASDRWRWPGRKQTGYARNGKQCRGGQQVQPEEQYL